MSLDADMHLSDSLQIVKDVDKSGQCVYYFKVLKDYYDYNVKKCDGSRFVELNIAEIGEYYMITFETMRAILKDIYLSVKVNFFLRFDEKMFDLEDKCLAKLNDLYQKLEFLNGNKIVSINNIDIMDFIDYNSAITNVNADFYHFKELCLEKDKLLNSLKYFCSSEELKSFDDEYSKSLVDCDMPKLNVLLKNAQNMIFEHWTGATTNIEDYKSGMPFRFLCHSVESSQFRGHFRTKFVSASLLTEKLMFTVNKDYGFILEPANIVAASDADMNSYNNADDINDLYYNSSILPAQTPEEVLENCYRRSENQGNDLYIYNEIVLEGFNPIGIFVITDGSKALDPNYRGAYKLQKNFPDLQIIEIDKTLYFDDEKDKNRFLHNLINNIRSYKEAKNIEVKHYCSLPIDFYNEFWQEFMELKKSDDYKFEEIVGLLDKNEALLFEIDVDNLFEKYNDKDLNKILKYSGTCYLVDNRYYSSVYFDKVYDHLKKYAGDTRLDKYVPGLSMFLTLMGNFPILTVNDWVEIHEAKDLEQVNIILARALEINSCAENNEHMIDSDTPTDSSGQSKLVLKNG